MKRLSSFAVYAWTVVAFNLAVILWGAYVRASGSGAGCGSHWPLCNGEIVPRTPQIATLIELTHRITSGLSLVLVVGLVVWAFRAYPKGHAARRGATLSGLFIMTEALIGAGLVLFELVADNKSMARAMFMSVHLINTFILLGVMTLTAWWASQERVWRLRGQGALGWLFTSAACAVLVLAVSGAVAALGDTLFPANTLAEGIRQDFSPTAHLLIRLRLLHPVLAVAVGAYAILTALATLALRRGVWVKRWAWSLVALVLLQLVVGLFNVALLAPVWLQLAHLLLADLLWIALVLLAAVALAPEAQRESFEPVQVHGVREAAAELSKS